MNIPSEVKYIIKKLNENGYEAYIVGGCVRDYLLGTEPKDWDITTSALPADTKAIFDNTYDTGVEHGTITVVVNKNNFEVTTYRIDGDYKDFRRPSNVAFTQDISEDLSRRDFTMNAIAYNSEIGFVDPFNGKEDIVLGIIRAVGDADKRFNEDALRMLRAVRFSAGLGFKIEDKTYGSIIKNAELIKNISAERIRDEFLKLICSDYTKSLELLAETKLSDYFLPELKSIIQDKLIFSVLERADKTVVTRLSILLAKTEYKRSEEILKSFRLDNKTVKTVMTMRKYMDYPLEQGLYPTRILLSEIGVDFSRLLLNIKFCFALSEKRLETCKLYDNIYDEIDDIISKGHCISLKNLAINGNDIAELGVKDGRLIGKVLRTAFSKVLENPELNEKNKLLETIKKDIL